MDYQDSPSVQEILILFPPGREYYILLKEKDSISKLANISTVKSLEFVDAQFLWILWEPLIHKINVHPQ